MSWLLPPLTPHFHAALRDVRAQSHEARMRAAQRLGMAEGDERAEALQGLATLSEDEHPHVRATAVAGLGELADSSSLDAVIPRLHDPSAEVRELAVVALGRIGGKPARQALEEALSAEGAEVRFQAVGALAEHFAGEAGELVLPLLDDPDAQVRAQVAETLGRLGEPHSRGHLARLLEDPYAEVALEAAIALAHQQDARGEPHLVDALVRRHRTHEVCMALATIATEAGCSALAAFCGKLLAPASQRAAAGAALASRGDPRGVAALQRVLNGFRSTPRNYAVELVGELGLTALTPELTQLCRRQRGTDPYLLVEALTQLATRGAEVGQGLTLLSVRQDAAGQAARDWLRPHESEPCDSRSDESNKTPT